MSIIETVAEAPGDRAARLRARSGPAPLERLSVALGEWDRLIAGFDGVVQEQLAAFAAERWPSLRLEPMVFLDGGEIVGGVLMMLQRLPLGVGTIAISKWGPMLRQRRGAGDDGLYGRMLDALVDEFADRRAMLLSILPRPAFGSAATDFEALRARGFVPGSGVTFPDRYIVDLGLDAEAQRRSLAQKWRYHLNKSEKAGLGFEHGGRQHFAEFDRLYAAMTDRKRFPDHSAYHTVPALLAMAEEALRPELFFVRHQGEIVAGAVIFKAGEVASYLYGATDDRALPLRAGYFLHWHIIGWLKQNTAARWYDLGGTEGFQGLHQFKKGMVGDAGVIVPIPPIMNHASHWHARLAGNGAFAVRDGLQALKASIETWRATRTGPAGTAPDNGSAP